MRMGMWVVALHVCAAIQPAWANAECKQASFERAVLAPFTAAWHETRCLAPAVAPAALRTLAEAPSGWRPSVFSEGMRRESAELTPAQLADAFPQGFGLNSLELGPAKPGSALANGGDRAVYAWVARMHEPSGTRHEIKRYTAGIQVPGGQLLQLFVLGVIGLVMLRRQWSMR